MTHFKTSANANNPVFVCRSMCGYFVLLREEQEEKVQGVMIEGGKVVKDHRGGGRTRRGGKRISRRNQLQLGGEGGLGEGEEQRLARRRGIINSTQDEGGRHASVHFVIPPPERSCVVSVSSKSEYVKETSTV
jgi:hypothetical protein